MVSVAPAIQLPKFAAELEPLPVPDAPAAPSAQPEPVFRFIQPATVLETAVAPAAMQLPQLTAEIEPMPVADELADPPMPCHTWMHSPQAEPVFAFVRSASAGAYTAALAVRTPELTVLGETVTYVPNIVAFRRVPAPEPVMAGVWPHVADIAFEPIASAASIELPRISALRVPAAQPPATPALAAPAAEAAEALVAASEAAVLATENAAFALPATQIAPAALSGSPRMAAHSANPAPEALESQLTAATAGQIKSAPVVRLQPFAVAASEGRALIGFDAPRLAPPFSQAPVTPHKLVVMPMATIRMSIPRTESQRILPSIPKPGMVPLEFHAQQVRGKSECKLEWRNVRFSPLPPRFTLRPVWEKAELTSQKPLPPKSTVADVFTMPEAKPRRSNWVGYAAKIAAGIVVVTATWYGASSIKLERSLQVRAGGSASSGGSMTSLPSLSGSKAFGGSGSGSTTLARAAKPESKGVIGGMRESISRRAAVQISDNLREGMEAWGAAARTLSRRMVAATPMATFIPAHWRCSVPP